MNGARFAGSRFFSAKPKPARRPHVLDRPARFSHLQAMTAQRSPANASPALRAALDRLSDEGEALIERTLAWSAINSGSREPAGLARMRAVLEAAFAPLPGALVLEPLDETPVIEADGRVTSMAHAPALRVTVRPEAPLKVALTGHYDTVFAAAHPFQTSWREPDGRLRGPGVADMKGGLVVMLAALQAFETLPAARAIGYEILLSPDEEIGSPASAPLLADLGRRAHVGMIYEPGLANGDIVSARKGSGSFSLVLAGRAAHVGRAFADGRSAITAAADAVLRLDALNARRDGVTVNCGAIDGGAPVNMVAERAVVRFNIRAPDAAAAAWAEAEVASVVAAVAARDGIGARLYGGFTRPPKPVTPAQAVVLGWAQAAAGDLGLDCGLSPSGGVCEGNNLFAAGCPNVDTLGPRGGALHSSDEFAIAESLAQRAQLSLLLLAGLAEGRFTIGELAS
jgi:glutamate carboxypeptidase